MEASTDDRQTYAMPHGDALVVSSGDGTTAPASGPVSLYYQMFKGLISSSAYPCVGAKAAVNRGTLRASLYPAMGSAEATKLLHKDLERFAVERPTMKAPYRSFVAFFAAPYFPSESAFDAALWDQLQLLHELDAPKHPWDSTVSADPEDPNFSFSVAGTAFFIVGLHPASSRFARKFAIPTLVFNAHDQFETLRTEDIFDGLKSTIRGRDINLQGAINPNLVDFGEASEARQYSGIKHDESWKCPFHNIKR